MSRSIFDPSCQRCILHHAATSVCVPADGPDDAEILVYGEAPGADEDAANKPFVGPAGHELDDLLRQAGLSRKRVRVSNVVRCRPPGNRDPNDAERSACMFYTVREISHVKPKVIVALGVSALKALTGVGKIGDNRGKMLSLLPQYRSSIPVLATYHPAAYLHNPAARTAYSKAIMEDMRLAQKIASGSVMQTKIVTSLSPGESVERTLRRLARCDVLGCDLEWEVLPAQKKDPPGMWPWSRRNDKLPREVSIAIAGEVNHKLVALSIPFTSEYAPKVRKIIRSVPTVYHNAMADLIWLYHLKWPIKLSDDTYLLASLLNIDSSLSLEALASTLTEMEAGWKKGSGAGTMPSSRDGWRRLLKRNANDAIATLILRKKLLTMASEQGRESVLPLYEHVLLPATKILARSSLSGTPVDENLLGEMQRRLLERTCDLTEKIGDALRLPAGGYEAIIGSGEKLAPYLEQLGLKLPRTKKTNKPSVTNDVLLQQKRSHPIVPAIIRRRHLRKREDSYYRPWRWLLKAQRDRRLHSVYRLTAASTGRSSAEAEMGYTFQQFPRSKSIRRLVCARPGWHILSVDQCLSGDTLVETVEGLVPIKDIQPGAFVFGTIGSVPVARKVRSHKSIGSRQTYNIRLSSGEEVRATAEHRFQQMDGSYIRVDEMVRGTRLMPFIRNKSAYTLIRTNSSKDRFPEHRVVAEGVSGRKLSSTEFVHHINHNRYDNRPSNLEVLSRAQHVSYHSRQFWATMTPAARRRLRRRMGVAISQSHRRSAYGKGRTNSQWGKRSGVTIRCRVCRRFRYYFPSQASGKLPQYCSSDCYNYVRSRGLNHRVVSITPARKEPVYCIEVEDCNNFALAQGIISHNSQIELRIIAWLARERRMLEFFREGKDLHTAMAGLIKALNKGWTLERYLGDMDRWMAGVTPQERFGAKPVNFGLGFGGGPTVVQKTARQDYGIIFDDDQAQTAYDAYHLFYPDVRPWQETFWRDVQRGYGETPLGRRRSVRDDGEGPDGLWRKYINLPVQATASDLSLFCMDYTWELLRNGVGRGVHKVVENIGFFHDAALLHLDYQLRDVVSGVVREAWEHPPLDRLGLDFPVPLVADIQIGKRWAT